MSIFYWNNDFSFVFNVFANTLSSLGMVMIVTVAIVAVRQAYKNIVCDS